MLVVLAFLAVAFCAVRLAGCVAEGHFDLCRGTPALLRRSAGVAGAAPHGPRLPRVPMATGMSTNVKIVQRLLGHPRVVKTLDRLRRLHSHRLAAQRAS